MEQPPGRVVTAAEVAQAPRRIQFDCRHVAEWPAAWEARDDSDGSTYWRQQTAPGSVGTVASCPSCRGREPRTVWGVALIGAPPGPT